MGPARADRPRWLPPPQEVTETLVPQLAHQETSIDGKMFHFLTCRTFVATALDVPVLADDDEFCDVGESVLERVQQRTVEQNLDSPVQAQVSLQEQAIVQEIPEVHAVDPSLLQQQVEEQVIVYEIPEAQADLVTERVQLRTAEQTVAPTFLQAPVRAAWSSSSTSGSEPNMEPAGTAFFAVFPQGKSTKGDAHSSPSSSTGESMEGAVGSCLTLTSRQSSAASPRTRLWRSRRAGSRGERWEGEKVEVPQCRPSTSWTRCASSWECVVSDKACTNL